MGIKHGIMNPTMRTLRTICGIEPEGGEPEGGGAPAWTPTQESITKLVNAAIGTRLKRFEEGVGKTIQDAIGGLDLGTKIQEAVAALAPAKPDPEAGKGGGLSPEIEKRFKAMEAREAQLQAQVKAAEDARIAADERVAAKTRDDALRERLVSNGVRPELVDAAVQLIRDKVRADENGAYSWSQPDDPIEPEVDIDKGIKKWTDTPIGLAFKPPRPVAGSGNRGFRPPARTTEEREYTDADLGAAIAGRSGG